MAGSQFTVHDRALLDTLEAIAAETYTGTVWRTTWATRDPLAGSSAGGRWNPANEFEVLYTSVVADGSLAEVYYHLSRAPVFSSAHVKLSALSVATQRTLHLDQPALQTLGLDAKTLKSTDYDRSQEIGAAAYFLEFDSILVASARSESLNLILFMDHLDLSAIQVQEQRDVNWPAWKQNQDKT